MKRRVFVLPLLSLIGTLIGTPISTLIGTPTGTLTGTLEAHSRHTHGHTYGHTYGHTFIYTHGHTFIYTCQPITHGHTYGHTHGHTHGHTYTGASTITQSTPTGHTYRATLKSSGFVAPAKNPSTSILLFKRLTKQNAFLFKKSLAMCFPLYIVETIEGKTPTKPTNTYTPAPKGAQPITHNTQ